MNLNQLTTYVRDLVGIYSTDVVSDTLIKRWINESYNELSVLREWDWLEHGVTGTLPDAVDNVHQISLPNGNRRVISAFLVKNEGIVEMAQVATLDDIERSESYPRYDVSYSGVFRVAPEQPNDTQYRIRYTLSNVELGDSDSPLFSSQFHAILAYRAAIKVLGFVADDTPRSQVYSGEYASLLDSMISFYELDHDYRPFQMGGDGQRTRRYYPWFRPA